MSPEQDRARGGLAKKAIPLAAGTAAVLLGVLVFLIARPPARHDPSQPVASQRETSVASDPVKAAVADIVAAYRKIIVLVQEESALGPADRDRVYPVGQFMFEENEKRLTTLTDQLTSDIEARLNAPSPPSSGRVEQFLDRIENDPALHDADKLAFRDALEDLAAFLGEARTTSPLRQELETRIAADLTALREIQALYEKELADVFSRFQQRGMSVRREAWEKYVAFLKSLYDPAAILKEYARIVEWPSDTRGPGRQKGDTGPEIFGTGLPAKTLVLTFDDGPHPRYTARVVDTLKKYGVPAVFFQVGQNIGTLGKNDSVKLTRAAEASRLVQAAGLPVANHTYSHALLPKLGEKELAEELEWTDRILAQVTQGTTGLFRAPYGARNERVMTALNAHNMKSIMWNIDSRDWADPIPKSIADRVLRTVGEEKRGILLFHDIHERTVEALPIILDALKAEGYQFAGWNGKEFAVAGTRAAAKTAEAQPLEPKPALYRESWAVLIGIDDYTKWPKLRYAVNDANGMRDILVRKFKFKPEHVFTLVNREATRENILSVLADKLGNPQLVKRDDRVFVFFAGHGITRKLPSGRDLGYIVPVEADVSNYHGQSISMTNFQDIAEAIPAKHVLFVMDSCYSGLGLTRGGRADQSQNYLMEISRRSARQMLTAGGADQQVADNGPNGHSVFTWTLLQALEGKGDLNNDGFITASELAAYIGPVVSSLSHQTPAFGNLPGSEGGEFVFELAHENEFLSALSSQLDEEAITLNSEIDRLRAEIARKSQRNQTLEQELASTQQTLRSLDVPPTRPRPTAKAESMWTSNDRGMSLFKERKYAEALQEFLAATRLEPAHPLAANNLGYTYYKLERHEEAVRWFEKTISLDPRRAIAYLNLGDAYAKLGRKPEAKRAFEKYLELQPTSKSAAYAREMITSLE